MFRKTAACFLFTSKFACFKLSLYNFRGVFKMKPNIYDGASYLKTTSDLLSLTIFAKVTP